MNLIFIIGMALFIIIIVFAVFKSRSANPEQSSSEMHPGNFKKPKIEKVEEKKEM